MPGMRTHADILKDAGATAIHARGIGGTLNTVRSWIQRKSIPASAFADFVEAGFATFEELAGDARKRRAPQGEQVAA